MPANSQDNPTTRYLAENERVRRLERRTLSGFRRAYYPTSLLWLARWKWQELRQLKVYRREKRIGAKWLEALRGLQGSKAGLSAIVIGNGPSQGYLTAETLARFMDSGGEVLAVNYWPDNEALREVAPSYLVISDLNTLKSREATEPVSPRDSLLRGYLATHPTINIACPVMRCDEIAAEFGRERVTGFIDSELRLWTDNISPLKPRGYISMSLYKSLALAIHLGYERIFIIGMDNTYPRSIYCDEDNRTLSLETHAGIDDWLVDSGSCYGGMGDLLYSISILFYDLRKFRSTTSELVNLDPYSLTDVFPKAPTIDVAKSLLSGDARMS